MVFRGYCGRLPFQAGIAVIGIDMDVKIGGYGVGSHRQRIGLVEYQGIDADTHIVVGHTTFGTTDILNGDRLSLLGREVDIAETRLAGLLSPASLAVACRYGLSVGQHIDRSWCAIHISAVMIGLKGVITGW